jgi:hypothetical protein
MSLHLPVLAGASDKLYTVLIVLAEQQIAETFVSGIVVVEQVSNMDGTGSHGSSPESEVYGIGDWTPSSCRA